MTEPPDADEPIFEHRFEGCSLTVRRTLTDLRAQLSRHAPASCDVATVELVLAEILNNIVEHGYAGGPGPIELRVWTGADGLTFAVSDRGMPLPSGRPPAGHCAAYGDRPQSLPEGGFGWLLIRKLACDIAYCTGGGRNRLYGRVAPRTAY